MNYKQAIKLFLQYCPKGGWPDYYSMQMDWEIFKDNLHREKKINAHQSFIWDHPTTIEKFNDWQKKLIAKGVVMSKIDRFDYATISNGIDAWDNGGKLKSAQSDFTKRIQGQPVSEAGIRKALKGLFVWEEGWGLGSRTVGKVEILGFYKTQGLCRVRLWNNEGLLKTTAQIRWDPEKNIIKSEKSDPSLEERIKRLEDQVALLMEINKERLVVKHFE